MRRMIRNQRCRFGHDAAMIHQCPAHPHPRHRADRREHCAQAGSPVKNVALAEIPFGPMNHSMTSRRSMPGRSGRRLQQQRSNQRKCLVTGRSARAEVGVIDDATAWYGRCRSHAQDPIHRRTLNRHATRPAQNGMRTVSAKRLRVPASSLRASPVLLHRFAQA